MSFTVEVVRKVYDDENGVFIEIGPDADGLGGIEVRTTDKESKEYYGDVRLSIHSKQQATLIGNAILLAAGEMT